MAKEMLINVSEGEECRIALMDNGTIEEFYIERTSSTSHVGNIYKGRVVNVEPSIQAAFIDFGLGRNGFLHISDLLPSYFGRRGEDVTESVGRKLARRDRPPIQRCLRRGDEIIVQIIKEGIGTKGPTLTTYLSIPGRIIVMMPGMSRTGVSRKIEDEVERKRLRQILDSLKPPAECGFIIRTAGIGKTKAEIQRDLAYLTRLWQQVNKKIASGPGPMTLYTEGDLVTRTVRDVFTPDIDRIIIDSERVADRVRDFIKLTSPRAKDKVELHSDPLPLFHKYNIEKEIEMMYSRHVPLPSGGSLVIDQTEAVVAIDVNSGRFRDHSDAETTAFKTDMEAADEIPRQLKLRDLGGVIICDFIDLRFDRHRRELERKLHDNFSRDRAKTKVLRMSQFGIIELTRQRMRPSVKRSIYCDCPHCRGSGLVKTPESMSLDVMRKLAIATHDQRVARVEITVHADVAHYLNNRKRRQLAELEGSTRKRILIKTDAQLGLDEVRFELIDARDGIVSVPDLLPQGPQSMQEAHATGKQGQAARRDRRTQPDRHPAFEEHEERFALEELEEGEGAEQHEPQAPASRRRDRDSELGDAPEPMEDQGGDEYEYEEDTIDEEQEEQPQAPAPQAQRPPQRDQQRRESQPQGRREQLQPQRQSPGGQRPQQGQRPPQGPQQRPAAQQQPRPAQPPMPHHADQTQRDFDDDQGVRRGRRGRRGRGRGRPEPMIAHDPNMPEPAKTEEELLARLPSNIWIQMPGTEDAAAEIADDENLPSPETAEKPQPLPEEASPAAETPAEATPASKPEPAPVMPQTPVKVAPIAEWVEEPIWARRRRAAAATPPAPVTPVATPTSTSPKPAAETTDDSGKPKRKRTTRKTAAAKEPEEPKTPSGRKRTSRSRKVKVDEADVSMGTAVEAPTVDIRAIVEEPKVRIADEPSLTRVGDRHLVDDETVESEPASRVTSRRDLDDVPDEEE